MAFHSPIFQSIKDTLHETVTNYVKEHSSTQDLSQTHNSETTANQTELFAQILSVSIDAHQLQYFEKSQKKLYKLDKAQILWYHTFAPFNISDIRKLSHGWSVWIYNDK